MVKKKKLKLELKIKEMVNIEYSIMLKKMLKTLKFKFSTETKVINNTKLEDLLTMHPFQAHTIKKIMN